MNQIETKVLTCIIALIGTISTMYIRDISLNIRELNESVSTIKVKSESQEKRIDKLEMKIYK